MNRVFRPIYSPALRFKKGERDGLSHLAEDIADYVEPRLILMPKFERDQAAPFLSEFNEKPDICAALGNHWVNRPAFIDMTYIMDEYGRDRAKNWLPTLFHRARGREIRAIPMAMLSDLNGDGALPFRNALALNEDIKLAICVSANDVGGCEFEELLSRALDRLGLTPLECAIFVDFRLSEFENPVLVEPIISDAFEHLQDFGPWQQIIFQGTHFPEVNPTKHGCAKFWPRNEWLAWKMAVKFNVVTPAHLIFGDYAADSAKINFNASVPITPIMHVRWALSDRWLIQRAVELGKYNERMRGVYKAVVECGEFAGAGFSQADAYIARSAADPTAAIGQPTTWRQLNTTHHITQAVVDIAKVRGISLRKRLIHPYGAQMSLLP